MSKYDQMDYLTFSEVKNKSFPKCIKDSENQEIIIPEELKGTTIENLKKGLNIKDIREQNEFLFANKNQTILNDDYFKNGNFFNDNMEPDEKKEFLLDYLNYHYGNEVNGKYFKDNLQEIFNLKNEYLTTEEFEESISQYFKKNEFDLNDPEDRKQFKKLIFHKSIKFLNGEQAIIENMSEKNKLENNSLNKNNLIFNSNFSEDKKSE